MKEVKNFNFYLINGMWIHCQWVNDLGIMKQYINGSLVNNKTQTK